MLGIFGKSSIATMKPNLQKRFGESYLKTLIQVETPSLLLLSPPYGDFESFHPFKLWVSEDARQGLFIEGDIFDWPTIPDFNPHSAHIEKIFRLFQDKGPDLLKDINGAFSMVIWDENEDSFFMARDSLGINAVYYFLYGKDVVFGTRLDDLSSVIGKRGEFNHPSILKYLIFCYNTGEETFYSGIKRLNPGHFFMWKNNNVSSHQYWHLSFSENRGKSEQIIGEEIRYHLEKAVKLRMNKHVSTGVFLSGGLDSSAIVSLLHQSGMDQLKTFSFRCRGESFDESPYARIVADTFQTRHNVSEYRSEDILLTEKMVALMDEPFCDVGINVATYLLANAAKGQIEHVFTGDGGDELFAGHPVYIADKVARVLQLFPQSVLSPLYALGRRLPDSERKKDWKVKIKRFSESSIFPKSLGTHRWRAYYIPETLAELLTRNWHDHIQSEDLFGDLIQTNLETETSDPISRSLANDYKSVVRFYLRRMRIAQRLGLQTRFPMLDPEVVSYCVTIPSHLKIKGFSDVKYIERIAVEPLLPHAIVHRKDKLGHSIPLKNWIRMEGKAREFILDLVSEKTIHRRGMFNPVYVSQMVEEHIKKIRNHSHRIWALAVLELWLRQSER